MTRHNRHQYRLLHVKEMPLDAVVPGISDAPNVGVVVDTELSRFCVGLVEAGKVRDVARVSEMLK